MLERKDKAKKISSLLKESWTLVDLSLSLSLFSLTAGQRLPEICMVMVSRKLFSPA
jgi:hypothetical protein